MTSAVKAIETVFQGHRFRSRLEARWAVFFTEAGLPWEYEPEGFCFPCGTHYLPDFFIPNVEGKTCCYFEVKPYIETISKTGWRYCEVDPKVEAARAAGLYVVQLNGLFNPARDGAGYEMNHPYEDDAYGWCVCPFTEQVGIAFNCRGARVRPDHPHNIENPDPAHVGKWFLENPCNWQHGDKAYSGDHPKIIKAFTAANMARFEHGANGR